MIIHDVPVSRLGELIAGLVREGLTFDCRPVGLGLFTITLTGGF